MLPDARSALLDAMDSFNRIQSLQRLIAIATVQLNSINPCEEDITDAMILISSYEDLYKIEAADLTNYLEQVRFLLADLSRSDRNVA